MALASDSQVLSLQPMVPTDDIYVEPGWRQKISVAISVGSRLWIPASAFISPLEPTVLVDLKRVDMI